MASNAGVNLLRLTLAAHELSLMIQLAPELFEGKRMFELDSEQKAALLISVREHIGAIARSVSTQSIANMDFNPAMADVEPVEMKPN
jgi:hypothetical protein